VKRMGLKRTGHAGQRRIFFVLDRATRKFPGDIGLWMQYIEFARRQKANKKLSQILTNLLRLHPTKPALWIYAAKYTLEEKSDITEARSYMQRALRFCKRSRDLWLEYAKLEMMYISQIATRGRILGRQESRDLEAETGSEVLKLPAIIAPETYSNAAFDETVDEGVLAELYQIPALSGAIPMAIFDAAMKQFNNENILGQQFFDIVASFHYIPCMAKVLQHVVDGLIGARPHSPHALACYIQQPTLSVGTKSADYPAAIRTSLDRLGSSMEILSTTQSVITCPQARSILAHRVIEWLLRLVEIDDVDSDLALVLSATLKKTWARFLTDLADDPGVSADDLSSLLKQMQAQGLPKMAESAITVGSSIWPEDKRFLGMVG